jgi:RHS repeat-associated protein
VRNQTETPKRYRYTGKERDEESGFYYFGARYYASWLGRWASCDPAEFADGLNLYAALKGRPNTAVDRNGTTTLDVKQAQAARKAQEQLTNLEAASDDLRAAWKKYENLQEGIVDQLRRMASEDAPKLDEAELHKQYQKQIEKQESDLKKAEAKWDKQLRKTKKAIDRMPLGPDELESASLKEQAGRLKRDLGATKARIKSRQAEAAKLNEQVTARGKKKPPGGGGTTGGGPSVGGGPKGGPPDPSKGSLARLMDSASDLFSGSKAGKVIATVVPILAKGVAKATPLIGTAAGVYGVATELEQGNVRRATLEAIGTSEIPFVSQTADIGLAVEDAGWAAKDILDPEQRAEQWFYDKFLN